MSQCLYHESRNKNNEKRFLLLLQKYNFQKYRDTNYRNKEIQIKDMHKYRNTNDRNTEMQITEIKICKL